MPQIPGSGAAAVSGAHSWEPVVNAVGHADALTATPATPLPAASLTKTAKSSCRTVLENSVSVLPRPIWTDRDFLLTVILLVALALGKAMSLASSTGHFFPESPAPPMKTARAVPSAPVTAVNGATRLPPL